MDSTADDGAIEVFFSYAHTDEELRNALEKHLQLLQRQGVIKAWHDRKIEAGTAWQSTIDQHLKRARVILLLVSADFLASDYCWGIEMQQAMARHEAGNVRVIPVILRDVDWHTAPFGKLQVLPTGGKPVTSWPNRDEAFANVARGIRSAIEELVTAGPRESSPRYPIPEQHRTMGVQSPFGMPEERAAEKIKVLFLAANPTGTAQLHLDEEIREITIKIRAAEYRNALELISRWAVRPDDLLQSMNEHSPHIVHFSGHGSQSEELILVDDSGNPKRVSKAALDLLFRTLKGNIRVVVLNACFSRSQAEAITEHIDCAIGMNKAIGDKAAITFAASFYRAIGFGRSVKESFDQGKIALLLEGIPEENTPELLERQGVDASHIILVNP
jgi:hypothetical protein